MANASIGILIIFYNKFSQTIECIDSFLPSNQNIYLLNNASDEKKWKALQSKYQTAHNIYFLSSSINLGPAGGRNILIRNCKEDWLFIVDNDVRITSEKNWKIIFDEAVKKHPEVLAFYPKIFNIHENDYLIPHQFVKNGDIVIMKKAESEVVNHFTCCGVILHKQVFSMYGEFDESLFAFEDYEYSIRALCSKMGALIIYPLDEVLLVHDHKVQKNKIDKIAVRERYNEERIANSLKWLMTKHQITFDHEWKWWTKKQVIDMAGISIRLKLWNKIKSILSVFYK